MTKKKKRVFVKKVEYNLGFSSILLVLGSFIVVYSLLFAAFTTNDMNYLIGFGAGVLFCLFGLLLARIGASVTWEEEK